MSPACWVTHSYRIHAFGYSWGGAFGDFTSVEQSERRWAEGALSWDPGTYGWANGPVSHSYGDPGS
jgi:hypothetical protein